MIESMRQGSVVGVTGSAFLQPVREAIRRLDELMANARFGLRVAGAVDEAELGLRPGAV